MSLDEILGNGFDTVHEEIQPDSIKIRWHLGKESISEVKQAIYKDLMELIGNDTGRKHFSSQFEAYTATVQDELRQELRIKLKEYFK